MNEFQLRLLRTGDLIALEQAVKREMRSRKLVRQITKKRDFIGALDTSKFESLRKLNAHILDHNSSGLYAPPGIRRKKPQNLAQYLPALLRQDWSSLYPPAYGDQKFYVYAHVDPRTPSFVTDKRCGGIYKGTPFYIGKGAGNRAHDLKRNQGHGHRLRQLIEAGYEASDIVHILFTDMDEGFALEIEAKLIYFFGTIYEKRHEKGCLLNLDIPPTPEFVGTMSEIVLPSQWRCARERGAGLVAREMEAA